jgi:hypothetical protein
MSQCIFYSTSHDCPIQDPLYGSMRNRKVHFGIRSKHTNASKTSNERHLPLRPDAGPTKQGNVCSKSSRERSGYAQAEEKSRHAAGQVAGSSSVERTRDGGTSESNWRTGKSAARCKLHLRACTPELIMQAGHLCTDAWKRICICSDLLTNPSLLSGLKG